VSTPEGRSRLERRLHLTNVLFNAKAEESAGPRLVCVGMKALAARLQPRVPTVSFPFGPMIKAEPNVLDIAAHFVRELRTTQPKGPYYLTGYCFSGIVAYEMARMLVAQGEEVPWVLLLETPFSNPEQLRVLDPVRRAMCALQHPKVSWERFLSMRSRRKAPPRGLPMPAAAPRAAPPPPQTGQAGPQSGLAKGTSHVLGDQRQEELYFMWVRKALPGYWPGFYDGHVTMAFGQHSPDRFLPKHGWGTVLTRPPEVVVVAGSHNSMMDDEPIVDAIASRWDALTGHLTKGKAAGPAATAAATPAASAAPATP
jgi:thioesterase domain-containing protein